MKRALALVAVIILAGCSVSVQPPGDSPPGISSDRTTVTVERVVDGDTLEVSYPDGRTETLRLLGVDTPEVHTATDPREFAGIPDDPAGRAWLQSWGENASASVTSRVGNRSVEIVVGGDRRGSYGRLLVFVYVDDEMLNRDLLRNGDARLYDSEFRYRDEFAQLERDARQRGVGVWGFEEAQTSLRVVEIHADAMGDDREHLNDEYIVFENTGAAPLDISGWQVSDESETTYRVPDDVVLAPGETMTLHTGSGTDRGGDRYWNHSRPVWNNDGDAVLVTTETGAIGAAAAY